MNLVAQVFLGDVGSTWTGGGINSRGPEARRRIVLNDKAVEIDHPYGAVRTDIGEDRRHPFVAAGEKVEAILRLVATAVLLDIHDPDELGCRLRHQCLALKTRRKRIAHHEGMSRRRR